MVNPPQTATIPLIILYGLAFLLLFCAGVFIGLFRSQDTFVALMLFFVSAAVLFSAYLSMGLQKRFAVFAGGMIVAGVLGVTVEIWGTANGYWIYHDLPDGRHLPRWLPFAWALAFAFIYVVERFSIRYLQLNTTRAKVILALLLAAVLPTWGEMVAINAGVWHYTWPAQIFGVPLLAILLLVIFHMGVNTLLSGICRRYHIEDPVFHTANEALIDGRVTIML